jgi:hypothetical protein
MNTDESARRFKYIILTALGLGAVGLAFYAAYKTKNFNTKVL